MFYSWTEDLIVKIKKLKAHPNLFIHPTYFP